MRYKNVVDACELWDDIKEFSGGDQFSSLSFDLVIGASGCRVSGGQKKRIALARALYADKDIYMIDEPTASRSLSPY